MNVLVLAQKNLILLCFHSEHLKVFDGSGTEVFSLHGWNTTSLKKSFQYIMFGASTSITIQANFVNARSYVKIDFGILKQRLNLGKDEKKNTYLQINA